MRHLAAALALCITAIAYAEEPGTDRPYADYYKDLGPAKAADPDDALRIALCLKPANKTDTLPADLAFEVRDGATRTPLPLDAHHCFELPANAVWAEHGASVHKNTSMKFQASVSLSGRVPKTTHLTYAELTASVPAFQRVIASQGMLARMLGPKAKGLEIDFGPGAAQTLVVHAPDGEKRYSTDAKGAIHLPYDPALNAVQVELSALPKEIGPDV